MNKPKRCEHGVLQSMECLACAPPEYCAASKRRLPMFCARRRYQAGYHFWRIYLGPFLVDLNFRRRNYFWD